MFLKTLVVPMTQKNRHFTTGQNHYIKPVECNFRREKLLLSLLIQNINISKYFALFTTKRSDKSLSFRSNDFPTNQNKPYWQHTGIYFEENCKKRFELEHNSVLIFFPPSYAKFEFHNSPDVISPQQIINIRSYYPAPRRWYSPKSHFHVKKINEANTAKHNKRFLLTLKETSDIEKEKIKF